MLKALLLVQDIKTSWNSKYLMLKRLEKLKLSVQSYVANNNNFTAEFIVTADEWELVSFFLYCLNLFT